MPSKITRRSLVGLVGASGLAGVVAARGRGEAAQAPAIAASFPLEVGMRFGRWTVSAVHPIEDGVLRVGVRDSEQREFVLEVLARDPSPLAPQPPAVTEGLAIYVRNGGDGWLPTEEEQGLAA